MSKNSQRDKSSLSIFTTLNIPTVTSHPSLKSVQWSADGQVSFITKNAVVILTPDHGINFDNDSVIKSTPNKDDSALGWFKTMIQHDQAVPMKWPDYSQSWCATSLGKNYLKGEWLKIFEVTPYLFESIAPTPEEKCTAAAVLQAQIVCIGWTPQIEFGIEPAPWLDGSLLILGSRSGHLTFMRYRNGATLDIVASLHVSDKWITQTAFNKWVQRSPEISYGTLIYNSEIPTSITALRWVHPSGRHVSFFDIPEATYWTGHRTLRVQLQKTSTDPRLSTPQKEDRLIITLFDGSFHVIRHVSMDPSWASRTVVDADNGHVSSEALSGLSRATFEKAEKGEVDRNDMVRIDGTIPYDDGSTFLWVYESSRPSDFSYKHDAKQSSTLVVAQMWETDDTDILHNLDTLLMNVKTSSRLSPLHMLRPFFLHLRNPAKLDLLHAQFLEALQPKSTLRFRDALTTHLFGWDNLLSLRMRLSLADFAWKLSITEEKRTECGVVAQSLLNAISHRILRTLIRHLLSVVNSLTADDIPFVSRIILQSLLHGCPADLTEEGKQLSALIQPFIETSNTAAGSTEEGILTKLNESCPACGVEVPLQDITTAVCSNGHTWGSYFRFFSCLD
ncbi:hypothetical protein BJ912DRAFT_961343 [Pholiota molesta]|nr:hypothetical protein BJ912DRAFT_961343 [Pholiota molesta]